MVETKDYRLAKETILVPVVIWNIISVLPSIFMLVCIGSHTLEDNLILLSIGVVIPLVFLVYSIYLRRKRKRFLSKGSKYPGLIIECDRQYGKLSAYYLYIQIKYKGKKKILKTEAFMTCPNEVLTSRECDVFELNNKFYPARFKYSKKGIKDKINIKINCNTNLYYKK